MRVLYPFKLHAGRKNIGDDRDNLLYCFLRRGIFPLKTCFKGFLRFFKRPFLRKHVGHSRDNLIL